MKWFLSYCYKLVNMYFLKWWWYWINFWINKSLDILIKMYLLEINYDYYLKFDKFDWSLFLVCGFGVIG